MLGSAFLPGLKTDPYWISIIQKMVMLLVMVGTWYIGTPFLLIVLASVTLVLTLPFYPKLWFNVMNPHVDAHMDNLKAWRDANIDDYQQVLGIASERVAGP